MIKAANNNSECPFTELLLYLISVIDLLFGFVKIIGLVIVESMVVNGVRVSIWVRVLILTVYFTLYKLTNTFVFRVQIKVVYHVE